MNIRQRAKKIFRDLGLRAASGQKDLRYYGGDRTIHATELVNVETDEQGRVVSVWFRCQPLPFDQSVVNKSRADDMRQMYSFAESDMPGIDAVVMRYGVGQ